MFDNDVLDSPSVRTRSPINKNNNSRDNSRASNRSNRSSNNSTPIVNNLEWLNISRAYGLWRNEFDNNKTIKDQIE